MASERTLEDPVVERGSLPLDIDDVHVLLQGKFSRYICTVSVLVILFLCSQTDFQ